MIVYLFASGTSVDKNIFRQALIQDSIKMVFYRVNMDFSSIKR